MADLPTGTITFLFMAIEGSTALWEQSPDTTQAALHHYDTLVEQVVAQHGGSVVRPRGEDDSRFAVFPVASEAVAAAAHLQHELASSAWPTPTPLRARMALHTGEAELRNGDYYGSAVNRCARLRAVAHGGQTLLSAVTRSLLFDQMPPGTDLRDLGEHRLRDLARPEHIYQLVTSNLPAAFPPLKTLENRPNNLPIQATSFIGREHDVAAIRQRLLDPLVRLVTLTGAGGSGKTRLALQIAAEVLDAFPDGVWFVDLAPISDPDLIVSTIATTLGVTEVSGQPLTRTLQAYLQERQVLLLLDNFEQLLLGAPVLPDLLRATPHLKLVVTSRVVLHLSGEQKYPVPPLAFPDPVQARRWSEPTDYVSRYPAVQLFVQRAQLARPGFHVTSTDVATIAEICARLDGLPLAIELAAARSKIFTPSALLARLDDRLRLLTGGARDRPTRQQTLRGAIDWSYNLLDAHEQVLFRQLAIFVGGCTIEAVADIVVAPASSEQGATPSLVDLDVLDGLQSLLDHSLLRQDESAPIQQAQPRFTMLESIRSYALERLQQEGGGGEELERLSERHATYYLRLVEDAAPRLAGPEQAVWRKLLEREYNNLRAALHWAMEHGEAELGLRLAGALWRFWLAHGYLSTERLWLEQVLQAPAPPAVRAKALIGAGGLAHAEGDFSRATALLTESLALYRQLDDTSGITTALNGMGLAAHAQGDYERAILLLEESLALARRAQDRRASTVALNYLGLAMLEHGDSDRAEALLTESLALARQLDNTGLIAMSLQPLALVLLANGDPQRARPLLVESLTLFRDDGEQMRSIYCLEGIASAWTVEARDVAQVRRAVRLLGAAEALRITLRAPLSPIVRPHYERFVAMARTRLDAADFAAIWAEGRSMRLEQAIGYALEEVPS